MGERKMRLLCSLLVVILALMVAPTAQAESPPNAGTHFFAATGVGWSRTWDPMATGWLAAGVCFQTGTCPYTEFENVTGITTTMLGGVMQRLATSGGMSLAALGQVGGATTGDDFVAAFKGGLVITYTREGWHGVSVVVPVKVVKVNGAEVQMAMGFGVSKTF